MNPAIVALVERRSSDDKAFRCLKRLGFDNFFTLPSTGRSGGLCMGWKSHSLAYAIPHSNSRSHLWNDLEALSRRMNLAWILAGDFNDILGAEEKAGGAPIHFDRCNSFESQTHVIKAAPPSFRGISY